MISRSDSSGFTLTEMLVVLAIMALVSSLAVREDWLSPLRAGQLTSAAQILASDLRHARAAAMATGTLAGVSVDVAAHCYRTWPAGVERTLGSDLDVRVTVGADLRDAPGAVVNIAFGPDGGSSGAEILLSRDQKRARVDLDWLTGRVDIRD